MKEQFRTSWVLTLCAMLVVVAPLVAQDGAAQQEQQQEQQFKNKLQDFESMLVNAVRHGAAAFAQRAADQIPPNVQLMSEDPQAMGFAPPTPDGGLMFVVVVPPVRQIAVLFMQQAPRRMSGPRPVGNASGANPDPMDKSPVVSGGAGADPMNMDLIYTTMVIEALKDAMLDNSTTLPLKDNEWLTVASIDGVGPTPGAVSSPYGHTTYLSIKGADLLALRQGKITRDDARKLVVLKQL